MSIDWHIGCTDLSEHYHTGQQMANFGMGFKGQKEKRKVYLLVLLGVIFLVIGLFNLKDRINWNDPYDGISWIEQDQGVVVGRVTGETVPKDVQPGDVLLKINQHEIFNMGDYTDVLFMLSPGETAHYTFKDVNTGDIKTVKITIYPRPILTITDAFRVVVALVYLVVGLVILIRYWNFKGSIHFYLVCLFSFSLYLYSYTNRLNFLDFLVYWLTEISLLFLPPIFFHFCLNFPVKKKWMQKNVLALAYIYTPALLLLVVQMLWFAGKLTSVGLPRNFDTRDFLENLHIIYFTVYFLASVVVLFHSRVSLEAPELKQQMKWIVTGTVLSLVPFFFLYVLPYLLNVQITPLMQASFLSLAFLPLSFAYAIMKYRLMDVDIIFKRGAAYLIASAAVLGLYFIFIALSGLFFRLFFPDSNTLSIATSALVVAFLFAPIRRRVQQEIDRFFYKEEYKYRLSLIEFGRSLSTESSMKTITSTIMDRVNKSLKVETVAIFLKVPGEAGGYSLVANRQVRHLPESPRQFKIPDQFLIDGLDVPTLSFRMFEDRESEWLYSLKEFYEKMGLYYFQPLTHRNEIIGVMSLGKATGGAFLSSEDLELLGMLSGYAAIALENARLYSSERNKARELELLKAYSENIIEGINVGVVAVNRSGVITTWNHFMRPFYGLDSEQVLGRRFEDVFPADVCSSILQALDSRTLMARRVISIHKLFIETAQAERKFANLTLSPFTDSSGELVGTLLVFDDITAKVQLEHQLLQSEKLSSLGLIAAGVAHEVNTPLTGISSFTQMLVGDVPEEHPHHQVLKKIENQCHRASEIVNNLLNFARIQTTDFTDVQLNQVVGEALNLLEHQFRKKNTRIERDLAPDLPLVRGNEGRLLQVLVNILLNARDAVPPDGSIVLRTRLNEDTVVVQIEDNGEGIPPEIIHRIYDPFFTTKDTGKGTGLGLSVSYGIIQDHSGRIFVDSRPGEGTCFTIKLPIKEKASVNKEVTTHEK